MSNNAKEQGEVLDSRKIFGQKDKEPVDEDIKENGYYCGLKAGKSALQRLKDRI